MASAWRRLFAWFACVIGGLHKGFSPLFDLHMPGEARQLTAEKRERRFSLLDQHLRSPAYLVGDEFTVGDPDAPTTLRWTRSVKIDIRCRANLETYVERGGARPEVHEVDRTERDKLAA